VGKRENEIQQLMVPELLKEVHGLIFNNFNKRVEMDIHFLGVLVLSSFRVIEELLVNYYLFFL